MHLCMLRVFASSLADGYCDYYYHYYYYHHYHYHNCYSYSYSYSYSYYYCYCHCYYYYYYCSGCGGVVLVLFIACRLCVCVCVSAFVITGILTCETAYHRAMRRARFFSIPLVHNTFHRCTMIHIKKKHAKSGSRGTPTNLKMNTKT